jgi:hypothetical protein
MSFSRGPKLVTDGLVLALDAANVNSFRGEPTINKSRVNISNWTTTNRYDIVEVFNIKPPFKGARVFQITRNQSNSLLREGSTSSGPLTPDSSIDHTFSVYIKKHPNTEVGSSFVMDIGDGAMVSVNLDNLSNEWERPECTGIGNNTNGTRDFVDIVLTGEIGNTIYVSSPQVEKKPYSTPFVDGTRGTTVATGGGWADRSGNNNHGELVNGPTFDSGNNGSIVFDGVNDYVNIPNFSSLALSPACTISIWSYVKQNKGYHFWGNGIFLLQIQSNQTYRLRFNLNGTWRGTYTTSYPLNAWHKLDITWDGTNTKIYINSEEIINSTTDSSHTSFSNTTTNPLEISRRSNDYSNVDITQFQIYNRALSAEEIQQNYNATKSRYGL